MDLPTDWLKMMMKRLSVSAESGSVACKMINFCDRTLLDGAGEVLSRTGLPVTGGFGERDDGRYSIPDKVIGSCAARIRHWYREIRDGNGKPLVGGLLEGARCLPRVLVNRGSAQRLRIVELRYLQEWFGQ